MRVYMKTIAGLAVSLVLLGCGGAEIRRDVLDVRQVATAVQTDAGLHQALNRERAQRGLRPVATDAALVRAAVAHARDMAQRGYFAHKGLDGSTPMVRMRAAGGCRASVAENIAAGQATSLEAFQGWMTSPGHFRNMMGAHYTRYGVGSYQQHYVMVLAGPCV